MDKQPKPEMTLAHTGATYKILKVTGIKGMEMPSHISTKEAVIVVLQGAATINLTEKQIHLKVNDSAIIPANESHTLSIKEDFQANVIMEVDSEIKFVNK